jgi:hypothetical protein
VIRVVCSDWTAAEIIDAAGIGSHVQNHFRIAQQVDGRGEIEEVIGRFAAEDADLVLDVNQFDWGRVGLEDQVRERDRCEGRETRQSGGGTTGNSALPHCWFQGVSRAPAKSASLSLRAPESEPWITPEGLEASWQIGAFPFRIVLDARLGRKVGQVDRTRAGGHLPGNADSNGGECGAQGAGFGYGRVAEPRPLGQSASSVRRVTSMSRSIAMAGDSWGKLLRTTSLAYSFPM